MASTWRTFSSLKCRLFIRSRCENFLFASSAKSEALIFLARSSSTVPNDADGNVPGNVPNIQPFENIPGSGFFTNLMTFVIGDGVSKMHLIEQESRLKYGPIFRQTIGPWKTVYVCDPDTVQQVYRMEGKYPKRDPDVPIWSKYKQDRARTHGMFFSVGETWHEARSALSGKMLKTKEVAEYSPKLQEVANDLLSSVTESQTATPDNTVPHLQRLLFRWSLESIGSVLFEKRFGLFDKPPSEEAQAFIKAVHSISNDFFDLLYYPSWLTDYYKTKGVRRFYDSMDVLYNFGDSTIQSKLKEINKRGPDIDGDTPVDLLTFLVQSKNMSLDKITANLVDILFASVDTTSNTSLWTMYNLAKNSEVQDKLHKEVTSVLKPGEIATPSKINQMHYLNACIRETLRLYPAAFTNTRFFDKDVTLMGYNIPKEAMVMIPIYVMGRDPDLFDDPLAYKPERWMRGDKSQQQYHPFASLPFGHGVRMCVGRRIARLEMSLLLSMVIQRFHLESMNDVTAKVRGILVPDKDVLIKFTDRCSSVGSSSL